jgi:hypothetical protein
MSVVEQHPKYVEWRLAMDNMIAAENAYFEAMACGKAGETNNCSWDIADNLDPKI